MSERLETYERALQRLREALLLPETDVNRDACIQRFEFTFELAWKAIQHTLRAYGSIAATPRDCFKSAWQQRWIEDHASWLAMLKDRNLTSHTYKEAIAIGVYANLHGYVPAFERLLVTLRGVSVD